jgi:hypothetical protein
MIALSNPLDNRIVLGNDKLAADVGIRVSLRMVREPNVEIQESEPQISTIAASRQTEPKTANLVMLPSPGTTCQLDGAGAEVWDM